MASSRAQLMQVVCQNMTIAQFADDGTGYLAYRVPDATGLDGAWDFTCTFSIFRFGSLSGKPSSSTGFRCNVPDIYP